MRDWVADEEEKVLKKHKWESVSTRIWDVKTGLYRRHLTNLITLKSPKEQMDK